MTQALSGAAIAAVIAVCWLLGRPRPKILRSTDTTAVAALNRGQMERLLDGTGERPVSPDPGPTASPTETLTPHPRTARERGQLLRALEQGFASSGEARRQAMALAAAWGDRVTLPLVRRGLRDSDPVVMQLAAEAMAGFRGRTPSAASPQPAAKAPRNVSRTR